MCTRRCVVLAYLVLGVAVPITTAAQRPPDPDTLLAAQRAALLRFKAMDGVWRGPATVVLPSGETRTNTQTERIGPFLDGAVKVIEGRSYDVDGKTTFNAFAIVSYDPSTDGFSMRSYALGHAGDFIIRPTPDGYVWEIPAGPVTIRYAATIRGGVLHEVGDRLAAGKDPVRIFEMTLKRIGDADWPAAGAVPPR